MTTKDNEICAGFPFLLFFTLQAFFLMSVYLSFINDYIFFVCYSAKSFEVTYTKRIAIFKIYKLHTILLEVFSFSFFLVAQAGEQIDTCSSLQQNFS